MSDSVDTITARTIALLHLQNTAMLSTHSNHRAGYPFGSLILYSISKKHEIVFFISTISEHYHNCINNPQVSILVSDPAGTHQPQKYSRVTILGRAHPIHESEDTDLANEYRSRFPDAIAGELAHSFVFFKIIPEHIRWIGGFGSMGWMSGAELATYAIDPVTYNGLAILNHMNLDHYDALVTLAEQAGHTIRKGERIDMTFVCAEYFELQIRSENKSRRFTIAFSTPCKDATAVRKEIISLLAQTRG
jgi:heme iron utilization protein